MSDPRVEGKEEKTSDLKVVRKDEKSSGQVVGIDQKSSGQVVGIDQKSSGQVVGKDQKSSGQVVGKDVKSSGQVVGKDEKSSGTLVAKDKNQSDPRLEGKNDKPSVYLHHYDAPEPPIEDPFEVVQCVEFEECHCEFVKPECIRPIELQEEHTLAIIKPSAQQHEAEIIRKIEDEGYTILAKKKFHLFPEQATDFFKKYYGKAWFPKVMLKLSAGPLTVMVLAKENAVEDFKKLTGPKKVSLARRFAPFSLRSLYGLRGDEATNGIHASESVPEARKEILYFFPNANPEPLRNVEEGITIVFDKYYSFLLEGLTEICKVRPYNPSLWFVDWLTSKDPLKPLIAMPEPPTIKDVLGKRAEIYNKTQLY